MIIESSADQRGISFPGLYSTSLHETGRENECPVLLIPPDEERFRHRNFYTGFCFQYP